MAGDPHAIVGFLLCVAILPLALMPFARSARPRSPAVIRLPPIDRRVPTTLGWRSWLWDGELHVLLSPTRRTAWLDPELRCDDWDTSDAVRGVTGIHAHLVPEHWEAAESEYAGQAARPAAASLATPPIVTGIVERFGRYVLGTEGWRAEWVIVRKLRAPTSEVAAALARAYPDVEIIDAHRQGR